MQSADNGTRGFTLIELLVAVVIVAVLAGVVTLAVGSIGGERRLAREAEQARALIGYACEQAELSGRSIGLSLNVRGYRFSRLAGADWQPIAADELRPRKWLDGTQARLRRDDNDVQIATDFPDKPQLACFSSGELTPFQLELRLADASRYYRLNAAADGGVALVAVDVHAR
jgi:general secretion pathway protein H